MDIYCYICRDCILSVWRPWTSRNASQNCGVHPKTKIMFWKSGGKRNLQFLFFCSLTFHLFVQICIYEVLFVMSNLALISRIAKAFKTQISMYIRAVWLESSLSTWRRFGFLAAHSVPHEDSDSTARMHRLIWVFARVESQSCRKCCASAHFHYENTPIKIIW